MDGPGDRPVLVFSGLETAGGTDETDRDFNLAALAAALILGGCAVAPVDGPYAYGYARPYYYDNGPVYY